MITAGAFCLLAGLGALVRWRVILRWGALGTLFVNVCGSFALGLLSTADPVVLTTLGTGALGALTTVSGLSNHVAQLSRASLVIAGRYLVVTVLLGVGAAYLGLRLA